MGTRRYCDHCHKDLSIGGRGYIQGVGIEGMIARDIGPDGFELCSWLCLYEYGAKKHNEQKEKEVKHGKGK